MAEILVMPKLGLTMEEGFLESWLCEPGAAVALGQPICEVETDKLTVVVESPYAGVLLRCIEPGDTVPVGEPIAVIGEPGEDAAGYRLYQAGGGEAAQATAPAASGQRADPLAPAAQRQTAPRQSSAPAGEATAPPPAPRVAPPPGLHLRP